MMPRIDSTSRADVGVTHVALQVTEVDASLDFYLRYASMELVHRRREDGVDVAWISDRTRPFVLVLIQAANVEHRLAGMGHVGVGCASRAELDRLVARARAEHCLVRGPVDMGPPAGYWAFLRDPDGHQLELSFGQEIGRVAD
jgi:catechol 2,3-dioxygenase-like lactoylglutathione lyase family enzyme